MTLSAGLQRCRGLCEAACGLCGDLRRESGTISALLSRHGQQNHLLPAAEKPHRGLSAAVLGSAASFVRARDDQPNNVFRVPAAAKHRVLFRTILRIIFLPETQQTTRKNFRVVCLKSSNLFSAGTVAQSQKINFDFL